MKADKELIDVLEVYKRELQILKFDIIDELIDIKEVQHKYDRDKYIDRLIEDIRKRCK